MTVTDFLDNFDLLAETPNAAASLRPLILHYAFRGVLTHRSAGDEPAERLLARSRAAVAEQMAKGEAKREKPAAPVAGTEQAFPPPEGWAWCRLVDTGQFINGLAFKPSDWGPTGRPIIRIQNLSGRNTEYNRTTGTFDSDVLVQDGDILVSWSATLDAFIWRGEEGVLNQHIFRVLPSPLVDKRFLYWLLKWVIRQLAESDHAHGLVMTHINRGPFLAHPIPIPPLAEQKRIAAKVDELMTLCDRLEAQQQQREHAHAALGRAALARFADSPTKDDLDYLFHRLFSLKPSELRRSILMAAVSGALSSGAGQAGLVGEYVGFLNGFAFKSEWFKSSGVRLCRNVNVGHGTLDWSVPAFVDEQVATELVRFSLNSGDIVLSLDRPIISTGLKVAIVRPQDLPCLLLQRVAKPVPRRDDIDMSYFLMWMNSPEFTDAIDPGRSNGVPHISTRQVERLPLCLPPLAEQRRIVAKVKHLMTLVDRLEADRAAARATGNKLMDAVVAELTSAG